MTTYVSMLRGINVGGHGRVSMTELAALYGSLGLKNVRTYVQSGNVVFESDMADASGAARLIEGGIGRTLGFSAAVIVRTRDDLVQVVEKNPFLKDKGIDVDKLYVTFLSDRPEDADREAVRAVTDPSDSFFVIEREAYLYCPNGYGRTKFSNDFFERRLKVTATTRNWKTVNALLQMAGG
jgi:uncharacterized protein (DUF1697 family)